MASVSMNFGPQNCGAVRRTSVQDQGAARISKIITIFQWVLIFEQSVNHPRGPRWWPQIGAAATWARLSTGVITRFTDGRDPRLSGLAAGGRWIRTPGPAHRNKGYFGLVTKFKILSRSTR